MEYLTLGIALIALVGVIFSRIENKKEFDEIKKAFNHRRDVDNGLSDRIREARLEFAKKVDSIRESKNREISSLQNQLDKLTFTTQNPLKYKVGDKAPDKGWVVTKAEVVDRVSDFMDMWPTISRGSLRTTPPPYNNQYTSTNIKTGETKTWAE